MVKADLNGNYLNFLKKQIFLIIVKIVSKTVIFKVQKRDKSL